MYSIRLNDFRPQICLWKFLRPKDSQEKKGVWVLNVEVHLCDIISINILWYPNVKSNLVCAARLSQKNDSKKTRAFFHDWSWAIILRYRIESNQKKIFFLWHFVKKKWGVLRAISGVPDQIRGKVSSHVLLIVSKSFLSYSQISDLEETSVSEC